MRDINKSNGIRRFFSKDGKVSRNRIAATIGVGLSLITFGKIGYDVDSNKRIAEAADVKGDDYLAAIPINTEDGIKLVPQDSLVIVNDKALRWPDPDEIVSVSAISEDGEIVTGDVEGKYLKKVGRIPEKKLDKYNRWFTVTGEDVEFEIDPNLGNIEGNSLSGITRNIQVLGSDEKVITDDKNWIGILYIDEDGNLKELYGKEENLIENAPIMPMIAYQVDEKDNVEVKQNVEIPNQPDIRLLVNTDSLGDGMPSIRLREEKSAESDENIIFQIPDGSVVYALSDKTEENEGVKWRHIRYTDPKTNEEYTGWASNDFLKEYDIVHKVVNTNTVGGGTLKLRDFPGGNIIDEIENGTTLDFSLTDYTEIIKTEDDMMWIKVTLDEEQSGYVAYDYLEDYQSDIEPEMPTEEIKNTALSNYNVSKNGGIIGIDVSESVTPDILEEMLKSNNTIGNETKSKFYENSADTSEIVGKINYVYIKIGASDVEDGSIYRQENQTLYKEQARICEKYGVPYGFYYYSTCINETEAQLEADYINDSISVLENRKYNLLPVAIDFEKYADQYGNIIDRQLIENEDGYEDLTEVKASLSEAVAEKQGNILLYVQGDLISDNSNTKILDIKRYNEILGDKFAGIWMPTTITGKLNEYDGKIQKYINEFNPPMQQIILEATNLIGDADINTITEENYRDMIEGQFRAMSNAKESEKEIEEWER